MSGQHDRSQRVHLMDGNNRAKVDSDGNLQVDIVSGGGGVNSTVELLSLSTSIINASGHTATASTFVGNYRKFALCMDLGVAGTPTDITVKMQFSSDGSTNWRTVQNWFWGDVIWDDATIGVATWDQPALIGDCPTQYARVVAIHTGGAGTFTLANFELHLKD